MQLFRAGILNVRTLLMVGVEQHFVQAAPIKYLCTFCAYRKSAPSLRAAAFRIRRVSQLPIQLVERNDPLEVSGSIQNTNLTRAKARAGFRIIDGLGQPLPRGKSTQFSAVSHCAASRNETQERAI
jgi:hypothetical protein